MVEWRAHYHFRGKLSTSVILWIDANMEILLKLPILQKQNKKPNWIMWLVMQTLTFKFCQ